MTNAQAAEILQQMADLLDISGANSFRIRSYRQAAGSLESWAEELEEIYATQGVKGLRDIPDIGNNLAEKLEERRSIGSFACAQAGLCLLSPQSCHIYSIRPGQNLLQKSCNLGSC